MYQSTQQDDMAAYPHQAAQTGNTLCFLPAEVRNSIWYHALVRDDLIVIDATISTNFEAGLLTTCKQIRDEAREMYFLSNNFELCPNDYDVQPMVGWIRTYSIIKADAVRKYTTGGLTPPQFPQISFDLTNCLPNWQNLMDWLRLIHTFPNATYLWGANDTDSEIVALSCMFGVARRMQGHDWVGVVTPLLDELRPNLSIIEPGWGPGGQHGGYVDA